MVLNSCGHQTSGWSQLYASDPNFATTYQAMSEGTPIANFHLQYGFLCHLVHLSIPSSKRAKLIWEDHYSGVARHFDMDKIMVVLEKYFYYLKL